MEVNTPSSILSLVEQGAGYTVLPGCASYRQRQRSVSVAPYVLQVVWTLVRNRNPAQPALASATERKIHDLIRHNLGRSLASGWMATGPNHPQ